MVIGKRVKVLYKRGFGRKVSACFMDKFWSICAMPIGVFACFTPVLIAWVLEARKGPKAPERRESERH